MVGEGENYLETWEGFTYEKVWLDWFKVGEK